MTARNAEPGSAGLIGTLIVELDDGRTLTVVTNGTWESDDDDAPGTWTPARVLGRYGCRPWGGHLATPFTGQEMILDFTRYDVRAEEPQGQGRNWSLMNRINQKGTRPQDRPVPLHALPAEDQTLIRRRLPALFTP